MKEYKRPNVGDVVSVKTWGPDELDNRYKKQKVRKLEVVATYQHFARCRNQHGYIECHYYSDLMRRRDE